MDIMVGADPEVFLLGPDKKHIGAAGIIPGTKRKPHPVKDGALQVDGMAAEFNITPVATSGQLIHNINSVLRTLMQSLPRGVKLDISPTAYFDEEYMKQQPREALELGCDPDFNGWEAAMNMPPEPHPTMRTAAGHVHLGWTRDKDPKSFEHFELCCALARQMDHYLGVPSVILDTNQERRKMYGKAGAFRPKSYGVEYRVLSNFWIKDNQLIKWVYEGTSRSFKTLVEGGKALPVKHGDRARTIIDSGDAKEAVKFCEELGIKYPKDTF